MTGVQTCALPISNPNWFSLFNGVGFVTIISGLALGLGYFGQPHIIVRFMALRTPRSARKGMFYGVTWMGLSMVGTVFVAIIGPAFFTENPDIKIVDQINFETIFLDMGQILFHPLIAGLVLTAVLAAIMSTISSQLLVVSSALVEDIYKGLFNKNASDRLLQLLSRFAVLAVALLAMVIAAKPDSGVLSLVEFAWAGFGSAFGPVIIASLYWRRLNAPGAIAGLAAGAIVSFLWGGLANFGIADKPFGLYEMIPGVLANVVFMVGVTLMTKEPSAKVLDEFDKSIELSNKADRLTEKEFVEEAAK